jgi:hypothetical protein
VPLLHLFAGNAVALVEHAQNGFELQLRAGVLNHLCDVGVAKGFFPRKGNFGND